ncbi:MAG: hypothetical protein AUK63_2086 [bacterium P3]|nr:MAG: hypothetical protein AUK63_2086 [bacterium P3]
MKIEEVNKIANQLYEIEKKTNSMSKQGIALYYKYCRETEHEKRTLINMLNEMLDDDTTFNEAQFKCFWQSGFIRNWNLCGTKDGYINTIKKYIELYGKPLEQDTIMYKAVVEEEELYGSSWTKHWKSACNFATKFGLGKIVSLVVPKGTKTIHIQPTFIFKESEDVIDTTEVLNGTLCNFAELKRCKIISERKADIVIGEFEIIDNGTNYLHRLDARDSLNVIGALLKIAA